MESIIGTVLGSASEYVDCHRNFQNDVDDLRKRVADLKRRRNDKLAELQTVDVLKKQVKEEVQGWLEDASRIIEIEMPDIEEQAQNVSYLSRGILGRRVRQKIEEVREIYDRGSFPEGLVIERPLTTGIPLPTENMVGEVDVKEKIWEHLRSHEAGIIGSASEHVDCHRNFQNDVDDLRKRVEDLKRRRNNKVAKLQTVDDLGKQVGEEVQGWLEDARRVIEIEMPDIEEQVQNVSYLSRGNLGRRVRQKIQEMREIYDLGSFPEGLAIERPLTTGIPLPTENLVGEVDVKEKIWEHLRSHEVGIIGSASEHVDCHRNFQNDVDDLKKRVADLKRRRNDKVAELLTVDGWLEEARRVIEIEMPDIEEKVQNVSYLSRGSLGRLVRQKIQEVREIYDRGSFLESLLIERPPLVGTSLLIENLVGEDDVKKKIWEYLRSHEVGTIGVCGIGGVGKTTVMKHIHNELLDESIGFEKVIWVTVSQSLNVVKLQGDIARKMNKSLPRDGDELERAAKLMEIMQEMKYALILDDVWDKFSLQRVGIPEPTIGNGCKIVITSRSVDVCNYLRCQIVKVPPLPQQESLKLFFDTVGQDILRIPYLEEILKLMVAECAGLPLAIVVIAGSMRGVVDIREWRSALDELRRCVVDTEKDSEDEIFKRLKFSYDRLPNSSIQECFLYCSLYPADWNIRREDLIENWICEGLVEKLESRRKMHDRGHSILNKLENSCLLEKGYGYGGGGEEYVKMHDVVRDMALRIKSTGLGRFMVKARMRLTKTPDEDEWTDDLAKVSLMENEISYIPINLSPKCLVLSTLTLEGNRRLRQIPECFFANMPLLKFLDLSNTDIEVLPNSICSLKNLTTLILRGCRSLECMPSLSKLKALKKLDLDGAGLCVAPEGIEMLENLEYLDLSCPNLRELPVGIISKLFRLQYLRKERIFSTEVRREEVARLEMLEWFEGGFDCLKDFNSFVSKLNHFGRPSHYWLTTAVPKEDREGYFWKFNNNDALKRVTLFKCEMGGEDQLVLPDDLQDLRIECCNTVGDISVFLKNLIQLRMYALDGCQGIECVVSSSSLTVTSNLEELSLWSLCSLRDLVKVEKTISPQIFSNLKELNVVACSKLKKVFPFELLQGQSLRNLEEIHVEDCLGMEEIIGWEEEEEEKGNQTTTTAIFTLPKLRSLYLDYLPELKKICPERRVMVCDSLNSICIKSCPKVKRIPLCLGRENGQPSLPAVKYIYIDNSKEWWESVEWENPDDKNVLLPFLQYIVALGSAFLIRLWGFEVLCSNSINKFLNDSKCQPEWIYWVTTDYQSGQSVSNF